MKFSRSIATVALAISTVAAFAGDHAAEYKVGVFSATGKIDDGSMMHAGGRNAISRTVSHSVHYISTDEGVYSIEAPVSVGKSILVSTLTSGTAPDVHKQWFMDQLHEGDQGLFAAKCDKHDNCTFWLPNPDKAGKEFTTAGNFRPNDAKTNTTTLCGKGKLSAAVEAQVCKEQ